MTSFNGDACEMNFDGLVGPTHNYGGLSFGNIASASHRDQPSYPREAALQGLAKMRFLLGLGLEQGVFPPHERPFIAPLRDLGFSGSDADIWRQALHADPLLARQFLSASPMWAANTACVSASADTADGRLHFTPANLVSMLHRSIEAGQAGRMLRRIFPESGHFAHHSPLPAHSAFGDEGAANHMRMSAGHGEPGVEIYVYGRDAFAPFGGKYPARQTIQASHAIARAHGLSDDRVLFTAQSLRAIDAGAFHNDVVAVAHLDTLFFHEYAFADPARLKADIRVAAKDRFEPLFVEVPDALVSLADAVQSYLFNSQLLAVPGRDRLTLILPRESEENPKVANYLHELVAGNGPIGHLEFLDLRQSMHNGGGPACLRLRVPMRLAERAAMHGPCRLDLTRISALEDWVRHFYRERLSAEDLRDPALMTESRAALDALTRILDLGSDYYPFQRDG